MSVSALVVLTLYAAVLRLSGLDFQSLWLDEAISLERARAICRHLVPVLPNGCCSWDSFPLHAIQAVLLPIFRDFHTALRLPSAVCGTILIPLFFSLNRRLFGSTYQALVAAFLLSFLTWEIAWSRQGRPYVSLQLLTAAGMILFHRFLLMRKLRDLILASVCAVPAIWLHRAGYLVPALYGALLLGMPHTEGGHRRRRSRDLFVWIGCGAGIILVLLMIPGHSNLLAVIDRLAERPGGHYGLQYLRHYWVALGFFFPLSVVGGVAMILSTRHRRFAIGILTVVIAYFLFISVGWRYFALRYSFPIFMFVVMFAAYALSVPVMAARHRGRAVRMISVAASLAVLVALSNRADMTWFPRKRYLLGWTAPQPDWRRAFEMIAEREHLLRGSSGRGPATISPFPLFHDAYLGEKVGEKYFLPVSYTGYPADAADAPPYTRAKVIRSLRQLKDIEGYIVLDDLGLRMLRNPEIREYLASHTPNAVIKREFNVFIWLTPID